MIYYLSNESSTSGTCILNLFGHRRTQADTGGLSLRRTLSAADNVRGGLSLSDSGGLRRTLSSGNRTLSAADSGGTGRQKSAADRPPAGGGSAVDPPRTSSASYCANSPSITCRVRKPEENYNFYQISIIKINN